ncbi:uncharacterized protein FIBRA_03572 [Fibroporia radiculosa]|uniref:Polyketide synthase phosphopantetheine-binding domain-containing protein n=1 Tax=Fibroporia radiculosa TaxID=599839 RepID=J4I9P4_9APHY|nr:uncharacterized protein FIBRA_03572 [Fibroporia radiculosa]CCM01516.1 predicted protein [Fibroporia radiculosa]
MTVSFSCIQGANCATFSPPTEYLQNRSRTIPELYDWTVEHNPEHPVFVYHDGTQCKSILGPQVLQAAKRAANIIVERVGAQRTAGDFELSSTPPVVAVLAATETITHFCFTLGVLYAGYTVFPLSTRNSPAAVAHLLSKSSACCIFTSNEPAIQALVGNALQDKQSELIPVHSMPVFSDLFPQNASSEPVEFLHRRRYDLSATAVISHSSGSTAFPKMIVWSHLDFMQTALTPWYGEVDLAGVVMGFHSIPMFHGLGLLHLLLVPSCGVILATFPPSSPAAIPTPESVFDGIKKTQSAIAIAVPAFIEAWSRDPEKVALLKQMSGLIYGGGPLSKSVGDMLTAEGVTILPNYGSTEAGVMNTYLPRPGAADWEYFTFSVVCQPEFIPYDDGTYELVLVSNDLHCSKIINTKVRGCDAYLTGDLLQPHPDKPGYWRVFGRADDQIMLANGEKTNPGPIENALARDPHVKAAVMFGRGRLQNGVIIEPAPEHAFDPNDTSRLQSFRETIWPSVERINETAPQHSRLFKEMILVASPSKPFQYTAKGTSRRAIILSQYAEEIDALYDSVDDTMQKDVSPPASWDLESIAEFVERTINGVLRVSVTRDADIFVHGCDSLQATWIRNTILRVLREYDPNIAKRLAPNFVFEAPSIARLSRAVHTAVHSAQDPEVANKVVAMQRMVEHYTRAYPGRPSVLKSRASKRDTVLVTGTTGAIGCNILAHLLSDETVERVYALNRVSEAGAVRQRDAFSRRGLDENLLRGEKFVYVEGDMGLPGLGIDPSLFVKIRNTATHIIHNAWRVDFNLALSSFENNIQGLRNLIDLSLESPLTTPPRLLFVSSVGVLRHVSVLGEAAEEPVEDPSSAVGSGYTESKWVAERILHLSGQASELRPVVVRVGQVCGDRRGYWNEREWFPSLVKSATVSWIPAYDAGQVLGQMRDSIHPVLHLAHPRRVSWNSVITPIAEHLGVPLVTYEEWVSALQQSVTEGTGSEVERLRENPALRLLAFFRSYKVDEDKEPLGVTKLAIVKASEVAPALQLVPETSVGSVRAWLDAWRDSGFLLSPGNHKMKA